MIYQHLFFGVVSFRMARSDVFKNCPSRSCVVGWADVLQRQSWLLMTVLNKGVDIGRYRPMVFKCETNPVNRREEVGRFWKIW